MFLALRISSKYVRKDMKKVKILSVFSPFLYNIRNFAVQLQIITNQTSIKDYLYL